VGKRARKRGDGGRGTRQRYKERALGLHIAGVSKPMLDAMNDASERRYGLGIGVIVQEEHRARQKAASLRAELDLLGRFTRGRRRVRVALRRAEAEAEVWTSRLREVSAQVADEADQQEVARHVARR
jgi:hypothetical protein